MPQSASSSVFFETTTVPAASCAFEWPATHERPATRERPTAYVVASTHERAAADEAAGSHEIASAQDPRTDTEGQMITLDIWRTEKRLPLCKLSRS